MREGGVTADLYAFLTIEPNAAVAPIHPEAVPVILTESDEIEAWMTAPGGVAKALERPLPGGVLRVVGHGGSDAPDEEDLPGGDVRPVRGGQQTLL